MGKYPFCYLQPVGKRLVEVCVTFILTLLSLAVTGFLAIGDARAGLHGRLHLTVPMPKRMAGCYVIMSIMPWASSLTLTISLVFGHIAEVLTPGVLSSLLLCDGIAKVAVNEC